MRTHHWALINDMTSLRIPQRAVSAEVGRLSVILGRELGPIVSLA